MSLSWELHSQTSVAGIANLQLSVHVEFPPWLYAHTLRSC